MHFVERLRGYKLVLHSQQMCPDFRLRVFCLTTSYPTPLAANQHALLLRVLGLELAGPPA